MPSEDRLFGVEQSLAGRCWSLAAADDAAVRKLSLSSGLPDFLSRLLVLRGVSPDAAPAYLKPTLKESFPDPSTFRDMEKAASLILDAILEGRKVTVFADYDVDGGTSSALLARYFRAWGRDLGLYVPDRLTEGYGPSPAAFRYLKEQGDDLVITVDCGAAATEALEEANRIGLPVIVIDHHLMGQEWPEVSALVNPNRPDDESGYGHLAAAGVVYVMLAGLNALGVSPRDMIDILKSIKAAGALHAEFIVR